MPGLRYGVGLDLLGNGLSGNLLGPTVIGVSALYPVVLSLDESKPIPCSILCAALFGVCTVGLVLKSFGRGGASGTTNKPFSSGNSSRV